MDNTIFTKRFQIINESLDSNTYENKYSDIIKGPVLKHKTEYTIYNLKQNGDVIYLSDIINNNEIQLIYGYIAITKKRPLVYWIIERKRKNLSNKLPTTAFSNRVSLMLNFDHSINEK